MSDERIFCGGILPDGSTCHATEFRERLPQGSTKRPQQRRMGWYYIEGNCWVDYCPKCGTKLGVIDGWEPITDAMVPKNESDQLKAALAQMVMDYLEGLLNGGER